MDHDRPELTEECHEYELVKTGDRCCVCLKKVAVKWSGIGCPCGHMWYCA